MKTCVEYMWLWYICLGYIFDKREMAIRGKPFHDYQKYIPVKCTPRLSSIVPSHTKLDANQFYIYA